MEYQTKRDQRNRMISHGEHKIGYKDLTAYIYTEKTSQFIA